MEDAGRILELPFGVQIVNYVVGSMVLVHVACHSLKRFADRLILHCRVKDHGLELRCEAHRLNNARILGVEVEYLGRLKTVEGWAHHDVFGYVVELWHLVVHSIPTSCEHIG